MSADGKSDSTQDLLKKADQLRLSGSYDESRAIFQEIVKNNPFLAPAKLGLGRVYFESGDLANARAVLEEFAEFVPDHSLANKILAKIYMHFSQNVKARVKIEMVLSVSPEDSMAKRMLQEIEDESASQERVLDNEDTKKNKAPASTATIAEIYRSQGHLKESLAIYKDLLKQDPDHPTYPQTIAEIEKQLSPSFSEKETIELEPDAPQKKPVHYEVSKPVHFVRHVDPDDMPVQRPEVQVIQEDPYSDEPTHIASSPVVEPIEFEMPKMPDPEPEEETQIAAPPSAPVIKTGKSRKEKLEHLLSVVQQHRRG